MVSNIRNFWYCSCRTAEITGQLFGFSLDPRITFCPGSNQAGVFQCPYSGGQVDRWIQQMHWFFTTEEVYLAPFHHLRAAWTP